MSDRVTRVAHGIARKVNKLGEATLSEVAQAVAGRDKALRGLAVKHAIDQGWIVWADNRYHAGEYDPPTSYCISCGASLAGRQHHGGAPKFCGRDCEKAIARQRRAGIPDERRLEMAELLDLHSVLVRLYGDCEPEDLWEPPPPRCKCRHPTPARLYLHTWQCACLWPIPHGRLVDVRSEPHLGD